MPVRRAASPSRRQEVLRSCGAALAAAAAARRAAAPPVPLPKHLAERILTSKSALEGERKQVTVLFADLKGSMELLAERDPEEARKILDPVLMRMIEAVHRYEGTVNQVMGDGIMALFGAPVAHEDHAVARAMRRSEHESIVRYRRARHTQGVEVQIRVGSTPATWSSASIGSDLQWTTRPRKTTHLAARMEQLAPPRDALTEPTLRLVEGFVQVRSLPVPVRASRAGPDLRGLLAPPSARGSSRGGARIHEVLGGTPR